MMKKICLVLAFIGTQWAHAQKTEKYCNERFDFCVQVISNFYTEGDSQNGDGRWYTSHDGQALIGVYGALEDDEYYTLNSSYDALFSENNITYKVKKKNYYIVSGINSDGNIFYMKRSRVMYNNGDQSFPIILTHEIIYPSSQQKTYAAYCKVIAKSFN